MGKAASGHGRGANSKAAAAGATMPSLTSAPSAPALAIATSANAGSNSPTGTPSSPKKTHRRMMSMRGVEDSVHSEKSNESTLVSRENATHLAFSVTRKQPEFVFAISEQYFQVLNDFCNFDGSLLAVLSESGNGKTALLANWASLRRQTEESSHELIHEHYCGCSYDSVKLSSVLFRFMNHLKTSFGLRDFELPLEHEEEKLKFSLARCLECAISKSTSRSKRRNIVLILDGIDCIRTEDGGDSLSWLPNVFPPGVKIIVSATLTAKTKLLQCCESVVRQPFAYDPDGDLIYETKLPPPEFDSHSIRELKRKKATFLVVEPFDEPKCRELLALYEQRVGARSALTDEIKQKIINSNGSSSPLYCRLVLQGLELFDCREPKQQLRMGHWLDKVAQADDLQIVYELLMKRWNEILLEDLVDFQRRRSRNPNANSTTLTQDNPSDRSGSSGGSSPMSLKSTPSDPDSIRRFAASLMPFNEKKNVIRTSKRDLISLSNSTSDPLGSTENSIIMATPTTPVGFEELEKLQILLEQRALLARHTLSLLSVSRYGLSEYDLYVLLGGTETSNVNDRVPRPLFDKLLWVLSPHLMRIYRKDCVQVQDPSNNTVIGVPEHVTLYAISHNQLQLVVRFGFLQNDELRFNYFRELANFFQTMSACQRRIEELPVQLERCTSWSVLQGILVDIRMFQLWWHERNRQEFLSYWMVLRNFCTIHDPVDDFIRSLDEFIIQENPSSEHLMVLFLSITEFLRMWQKVEEAKNGSANSNSSANGSVPNARGSAPGNTALTNGVKSTSASSSAGSPNAAHLSTHTTTGNGGNSGGGANGGAPHPQRPGTQLNRPEPPQLQEFLTSLGTFSLSHFSEQESKRIKQEIDILSVHSDDGYHVRRWLWTQFPLIAVAFESRFLRNLVVSSRFTNAVSAGSSSEGRGNQKRGNGGTGRSNNNNGDGAQDQTAGAKTTSFLPPTKGATKSKGRIMNAKASPSPSPGKKALAKVGRAQSPLSPAFAQMFGPAHAKNPSGSDADPPGFEALMSEFKGSQGEGIAGALDGAAGTTLGNNSTGGHVGSSLLLGDANDMSGGMSVGKLEAQLLDIRMQYDKLKFFAKEKRKMLKALESTVFEARVQKEHEDKSFSLIEQLNHHVHVANEETFVGRTRSDYYKSILRHCEVNPARDPNAIENAERFVNNLKQEIVELQQKSQLLWYERKLALVETPKLVEVIKEKAKMHQTVIARLRWRQRLLQRKFMPVSRESLSREAAGGGRGDNNNYYNSSSSNPGNNGAITSSRQFRQFLSAVDAEEEEKTLSRVKDKMMHKITTSLDRHRKVDSVKVFEGSEYKDDGILGILRHVGVNKPEEAQWYWQDQLDHAVQLEEEEQHAEQRVSELRQRLALLQTQLLNLKLGTGVAVMSVTPTGTSSNGADEGHDKETDPAATPVSCETRTNETPADTTEDGAMTAVVNPPSSPSSSPSPLAPSQTPSSTSPPPETDSAKGHNIKQIEHQLNEATLIAQQKKERAIRMKNLWEKLHLGLLHLAQMLGVSSASGMESIGLVDAIEQVVRLLLGDGAPLPGASSSPSNFKYRGSTRSVLLSSASSGPLFGSTSLPTSRTAEERIKYNIRVDHTEHVKRRSLIDGVDDYGNSESSGHRVSTPGSETADDDGEEDDPVRKRLEIKTRARVEAEKKRTGQRRGDKRSKPMTPGGSLVMAASGTTSGDGSSTSGSPTASS